MHSRNEINVQAEEYAGSPYGSQTGLLLYGCEGNAHVAVETNEHLPRAVSTLAETKAALQPAPPSAPIISGPSNVSSLVGLLPDSSSKLCLPLS